VKDALIELSYNRFGAPPPCRHRDARRERVPHRMELDSGCGAGASSQMQERPREADRAPADVCLSSRLGVRRLNSRCSLRRGKGECAAGARNDRRSSRSAPHSARR
jgi:hypothetical protein